LRVIVADDEPPMVSLLRRRLEATGRVEVVGEALTGDECVKMANALRPDALFLDIAMPDLDGIEVAELVLTSSHPPLIAFVTSFPDHAIKAFEMEAIDYIFGFSPECVGEYRDR